jgi:hypothetical protein
MLTTHSFFYLPSPGQDISTSGRGRGVGPRGIGPDNFQNFFSEFTHFLPPFSPGQAEFRGAWKILVGVRQNLEGPGPLAPLATGLVYANSKMISNFQTRQKYRSLNSLLLQHAQFKSMNPIVQDEN